MSYGSNLSSKASGTLRRLAWAIGLPILFNGIFNDLSAENNKEKTLLQKTFTNRKLTLNKYGEHLHYC